VVLDAHPVHTPEERATLDPREEDLLGEMTDG